MAAASAHAAMRGWGAGWVVAHQVVAQVAVAGVRRRRSIMRGALWVSAGRWRHRGGVGDPASSGRGAASGMGAASAGWGCACFLRCLFPWSVRSWADAWSYFFDEGGADAGDVVEGVDGGDVGVGGTVVDDAFGEGWADAGQGL